MVDFRLLGKLSKQEDIVVALAKDRVYKKILILVKDSLDIDRISLKLFDRLKEHGWIMSRPTRDLHSKDHVCVIHTASFDTVMMKIQGQRYDLVWLRAYRENLNDVIVRSQVTGGFYPLALDGHKIDEDTNAD